ncbi:thioredoxin [Thiocapsa imhoffii]|uniref:Thioredoxin n=1 Tax=Thiocapsa imhoffii TaxID=382777 RepID=A0A9X0WHP4_9GAMM|nr:thioredoxin fold domain-containing protein [Thiocapsa imhoffii]MBK1644711.1 thioredoxin [Thiocapsa imhoffii]
MLLSIARSLPLLCGLWCAAGTVLAETMPSLADSVEAFDDFPRADALEYPDWFKLGFLDLPVDLEEAIAQGKQGLIVYFGQQNCAYCHKLLEENFVLPDILEYTQRHFDLVPIDIWGAEEVTTLDGEVMSERDFSLRENTNFTPSLLFYNRDGELALKLRGYYPPYQFRAALEYVADGHYQRESFRAYLARGEGRMVFEPGDLNEQPFFTRPPFNLDRRFPSTRPLAVFFEQGDCHACDVLHGYALSEPAIIRYFADFDSVQLDMWSDVPVVTPAGERTTARAWAAQLGLFYAPSILFFDEGGTELLRVDSVVSFYRLDNVLNYIATKAYLNESFGAWRLSQRR